MPLPVSEIWEDTMVFVKAEWGLLAPVSLALIGVSSAAVQLGGNPIGPQGINGTAAIIFVVSTLVSQIGQMTIIALALTTGGSVRDALGNAMRRLPRLIGIAIILVSALLVVLFPVGAFLAANGIDIATPPDRLPGLAVFVTGLVMGLMFWVSIRLFTMTAVIVDTEISIGETLKRSFKMTRGHTAVLLGITLLYFLVLIITTGAASAVVGTVFGLLGKFAEAAWTGPLMGALAGGMVAAGIGVISNVFVARIYQQVKG